MPPPFTPLDLRGFAQLLDAWSGKPGRREVNEVHMHHTWQPDHAGFRGHDTIVGMWRHHTQTNGWSDIAQHVTIDPQGTIWTGRHWDQQPASSAGRNGTRQRGPFMFEMVGDFDTGRDLFEGAQRDTVLRVIALVQDAFGLPVESLLFHRALGSPKTCPGDAIRYEEVVAAVRPLRGGKAKPRGAARSATDLDAERSRVLDEPPAATEPPDAEPPEDHAHGAAGLRDAPALGPAMLSSLRPHVVNLWGGRYSRQGMFRTEAADMAAIFEEYLPRHLDRLPARESLPIVLYAHGGLVSEEAGLGIAAGQMPWWLANGAYPIHFVWETGFGETIARMLGAQRATAMRAPATERSLLDPVVEGLVRRAGGRHVWGGMKQGAAAAFDTGGDGLDVVERLATFVKANEGRVTLHAIGHSAGSIFHAHLLPRLFEALGRHGVARRVEALHLMAPAVTVAEYKARLDPLIGNGIGRLVMFTMAKDFELADTVTPAYRKSLLYLISRALEAEPGTPILGLEESVRADDALRARFGLGGAAGAAAEVIWSRTRATSGTSASLSVTHGGFDNDAATMESILRRIRGLKDADALDMPFPHEVASSRSFADMPAAEEEAPVSAATPTHAMPAAEPPEGGARRKGRRRALCVGIDQYPDPQAQLSGCVADARAWSAALVQLGFEVTSLHDAAATRQGIVGSLNSLLQEAQPGDQLAFTFAGHGMQVDDIDADEAEDDAKDEAICPFDYAKGRLVIDDDLAAIFRKLDEGVHLTCFFDCCHSGTNTRFAVGRAELPAGAKARYLVPGAELLTLHRAFRASLGAAPGSGARGPGMRPGPAQMRQVVFAACQPWEVALEMNGRGDFSLRAVPEVAANAGRITNAAFQEMVTARFGTRPRQNPNLDCAPTARDAIFLAGAQGPGGQAATPSTGAKPGTTGNTSGGRLGGWTAEARVAAAADLLDAAARLLR